MLFQWQFSSYCPMLMDWSSQHLHATTDPSCHYLCTHIPASWIVEYMILKNDLKNIFVTKNTKANTQNINVNLLGPSAQYPRRPTRFLCLTLPMASTSTLNSLSAWPLTNPSNSKKHQTWQLYTQVTNIYRNHNWLFNALLSIYQSSHNNLKS